MTTITIKEIEEAQLKVLDNARELIDEAEILFDHSKYARAYTLAHLAAEELAKLETLLSCEKAIVIGKPIEWKDATINQHKPKIHKIIWDEIFLNIPPIVLSERKTYDQRINLIDKYNDLKNMSLYTGESNGAFLKPSEIIREDHARNAVNRSNLLLEWLDPIIRDMIAKPNLRTLLDLDDIYLQLSSRLRELRSPEKQMPWSMKRQRITPKS
jgi:AbiV family abortive infection protein